MPSKGCSSAQVDTTVDSRPRLIGAAMLVIVALLWQLHGCTTPVLERQMAEQPAELPPQMQLAWNPPATRADGSPLIDIAGYTVHYGPRSRTYTFTKRVGNQTSAGLSGLVPGRIYFFAVIAHDSAGHESSLSDELSQVVPRPPTHTLMFMQDALTRGQAAQFWVVGARPGEVVSFLQSPSSAGDGPCSPQLGGLCVDLPEPSACGEATADDFGTAILTRMIPTTVPLGQVTSMQAVIRRGPEGMASIKTNVITSRVTD